MDRACSSPPIVGESRTTSRRQRPVLDPEEGGEPTRVVSIEGRIGAYALSTDGKRVAFVGIPAETPSVRTRSPTSGSPNWAPHTTQPDRHLRLRHQRRARRRSARAARSTAKRPGLEPRRALDPDRRRRAGEREHQARRRRDRKGRSRDVWQQRRDVLYGRRRGAEDRLRPLDAHYRRRSPRDRHGLDRRGKETHDVQRSPLQPALDERTRGDLDASFDGRKIQGWILKPPAFDATKKYPFILQIHGGPHSAYGNTFTHEFQWMAAKGYVVLYTNPRGSSNYGQDFGNIIQYNYPGDDYKDLMAGVDEVLKKGYVDETRLGVTGGSGGGLLTNWVVTQTSRFKAAVSQRDISDWATSVHGRLHALHPDLVPQGAVRRPGGLCEALADYPCREDSNAADVHPRRRRLADAAGGRRRGSLSSAEVPQAADRHGPLPLARATNSPARAVPGTASNASSTSSAGSTNGCSEEIATYEPPADRPASRGAGLKRSRRQPSRREQTSCAANTAATGRTTTSCPTT